MNNSAGKKETWTVRVEVVDIFPKNFKEAVKFYNPYKNKLMEESGETKPVYNVRFLLKDSSLGGNDLLEAYLFSWDGKGADFLPSVNLSDIEISSLKAESSIYEDKINRLLEESTVENPVEISIESCPHTGSKNIFRVIGMNW